jgi:hypothetical protein
MGRHGADPETKERTMRKPQSPEFWKSECVYISGITDRVQRGDKTRALDNFSGSTQTLIRYCEMQRGFAAADGCDDSAQYIDHCIDDLKGE